MKLKTWERWGLVAILLLAWALRWIALMDVPPGWRDDDLIELYTFSKEIWENGPELYFAGASGHEPLYHTLRAPLLAAAGLNQASARWQASVFGTMAVLLTWAVGRRMFTREVGLLSGALVAVSFWALMYSRVAIRHIGALPWMLLAIYWGWRVLQDAKPPRLAPLGIAIGTACAMLTYYAGRLMPALLGAALIIVGARKGRWQRYLLALGAGVALSTPMFWAAAHIPGADARVGELAVPLTELRNGNLQPLLQTIWTTLGMFHAQGDPEWLYNIANRPVFGYVGALLFYVGIATRLAHMDQANARMTLLWLAAGVAPAFISLPPSSYGHTILALPAAYILTAMPMKAAARRWAWTTIPLIVMTLGVVAVRDLPDYFFTWPQHSMVRFLYRSDYRALTRYLDTHPEVEDVVVGSFLFGQWDKVAVATDLKRQDARLRWVNPARALAGAGETTPFFSQNEIKPAPPIQAHLETIADLEPPGGMQGYRLNLPAIPDGATLVDIHAVQLEAQPFAQALRLQAIACESPPAPGAKSWCAMWWEVIADLPLPAETLLPNPPPPGVYSGLRLSIFAHLITVNGEMVIGDDGLWVDPYSLRAGDRFVQWHQFAVPADAPPGPYQIRTGLYDPMTGERWKTPDDADMIVVSLQGSEVH
ncbi:MAG: glycosyltransferase family 39 protein [Anaerolineae bacterium]|nr:glycosyltransferase family 39 protein [Anaerolineae bacterium]